MDKTNDPKFFKSIEKYDLVFLAETHLGYNSTIKNIDPFHYHPILVLDYVNILNARPCIKIPTNKNIRIFAKGNYIFFNIVK
jgi:hypothetical protein